MKWSALVKAAARSSKVISKKKPANLPIIRSLLTFKTAVSIKCSRVVGWKLGCEELVVRKESVSIDYICEKFDL